MNGCEGKKNSKIRRGRDLGLGGVLFAGPQTEKKENPQGRENLGPRCREEEKKRVYSIVGMRATLENDGRLILRSKI